MASDELTRLESEIGSAMLADQYRLRKRIRSIRRDGRQGRSIADRLQRLDSMLQRSRSRRAERDQSRPSVCFEVDLPICQHLETIGDALQNHQVVVVSGEISKRLIKLIQKKQEANP